MSSPFKRFPPLLCKKFLNLIIILCFITPAVVSYWRGTWYIFDLFVFPGDKVLSASLTFTASFGTIFLLVLVEDYIKEFLDKRKARKGLYLVLFYPLAFLSVTSWRGLWMLLDLYTTTALTSAFVSHIVGFLILLCTKASSSIIAVPGYCASERHIDLSKSILEGKRYLRIRTTACADITTRMLNSFVTVIIIGGAVICYWRGTWLIFVTTMVSPTYYVISWATIVSLGYAVVIMCYCLSEFIISIELTPPYSLLSRSIEQVFVYILGFGVVASWAGIWHLMDIYLLPGVVGRLAVVYCLVFCIGSCEPVHEDRTILFFRFSEHKVVDALVCHFAGIVVLYVLQASVNLVGSPAGCRVHGSETLEGFNFGSYLQKTTEPAKQENIASDQ